MRAAEWLIKNAYMCENPHPFSGESAIASWHGELGKVRGAKSISPDTKALGIFRHRADNFTKKLSGRGEIGIRAGFRFQWGNP